MSRDRRFGARWTPLQRAKNDAIFAALCAGDSVASRLPLAWTERIVARLARAVVLRSGTARSNALAVFPHWSEAARRQLLEHHAERLAIHASAALAVTWGRQQPAPLPLRAESAEVLASAMQAGRGVVLASAHLGAWERVAHTLAARAPFAAVTREPYDPRLERWLSGVRARVTTIPRGAPGAARAMLRVLRDGGVLGIPMDLATRGAESTDTIFLGQRTAMVTGPARLALRTGAALVVATYTHSAGRESLRVRRIVPKPNDPRATTDTLARALTDAILECPEEWLWLHPRWTSPAPTKLYWSHGGRRAART